MLHINYPRQRVQDLADSKYGRKLAHYMVTFPGGVGDEPEFELIEVGWAGWAVQSGRCRVGWCRAGRCMSRCGSALAC